MSLSNWFEHRTGFRKFIDLMLLENIPGGARWRYVWGSALTIVFAVQLITGVMLMTAYSPGNSTAWGSVYFIQYEMDFGWLIRGLHHMGSQTMVVLLALHMLQVVIAGAQLPPREVNWWLGLGLMLIVLGLSLTGYLLPWDQKGYYATRVATNIAASAPLIGPWLQKVILGGPEFGNATLTRFYALHVAILPGILIALLVAHIAVFRRHGVTYPTGSESRPEGWFWPDQAFRDLIIGLAFVGLMLFVLLNGHGHPVATDGVDHPLAGDGVDTYTYWAKAGQRGLGVNLDAPADPAREYPARPEWYFLFLFQGLKYFEGDVSLLGFDVPGIVVGAFILPGVAFGLLLILPLLGIGRMKPFGWAVGVLVVMGLVAAVGTLTLYALADDTADPIARTLLRRLGTYAVPLVAVVWLLYVYLVAALKPGVFRGLVRLVGYATLTGLFLLTGLLTYVGMNFERIPPQVADFIRSDIEKREHATAASKAEFEEARKHAEDFQARLETAARDASRAIWLARGGSVPNDGAVYLLRRDPLTQFRSLFIANCAVCHSYGEFPDILTAEQREDLLFRTTQQKGWEEAKFTAADLGHFGSKEWLHAFLKDPGGEPFYARSKGPDGEPIFTSMARWVGRQYKTADDPEQVKADFGKIAAWLAQHPDGPADAGGTPWGKTEFAEGFQLFGAEGYDCTSCHRMQGVGEGDASAPDLTGYGGVDWLRRMVTSPSHPSLYGKGKYTVGAKGEEGKVVFTPGMMPSFRDTGGVDANIALRDYLDAIQREIPELRRDSLSVVDLGTVERELIIRYLAGDDRVLFGGQPITAVDHGK